MKALLYYIKWPFCALILRDIGQYFVGYFLDYTVCSIAALVQHYCSFLIWLWVKSRSCKANYKYKQRIFMSHEKGNWGQRKYHSRLWDWYIVKIFSKANVVVLICSRASQHFPNILYFCLLNYIKVVNCKAHNESCRFAFIRKLVIFSPYLSHWAPQIRNIALLAYTNIGRSCEAPFHS